MLVTECPLTVQEAVVLEAAAAEERVEGVQRLLTLHRLGIRPVDVGCALRGEGVRVRHLRQLPIPGREKGEQQLLAGAVQGSDPCGQLLGAVCPGRGTVWRTQTQCREGREEPWCAAGRVSVFCPDREERGPSLARARGNRAAPHLSFMSSGTPLSGNMEAMALKIMSLGNCFLELFLFPEWEMIEKEKSQKTKNLECSSQATRTKLFHLCHSNSFFFFCSGH